MTAQRAESESVDAMSKRRVADELRALADNWIVEVHARRYAEELICEMEAGCRT